MENELEGLSASIDVKLEGITSQVSGLDGRVTTVEQTANGLTTTITGKSNYDFPDAGRIDGDRLWRDNKNQGISNRDW